MNILYFSATWCGPCKAIKPKFEKFVEQMGDRVSVAHIDVDSDTRTSLYSVRSVPTFVFLKDGKEVERVVGGNASMDKFVKIVENYETQD
jgi:thioredoxin 1